MNDKYDKINQKKKKNIKSSKCLQNDDTNNKIFSNEGKSKLRNKKQKQPIKMIWYGEYRME